MASIKSFIFGTAEHTIKDGAKTGFLTALVTGTLAAAATVGLSFLLFSNPVGWMVAGAAFAAAALVGGSFGIAGGTLGAAFGAVTGGIRGVRANGDRQTSEIEQETARLQAQNARKMQMVQAAGGFDNPNARSDAAQRLAAQSMQPGAQVPGR